MILLSSTALLFGPPRADYREHAKRSLRTKLASLFYNHFRLVSTREIQFTMKYRPKMSRWLIRLYTATLSFNFNDFSLFLLINELIITLLIIIRDLEVYEK